MISTNTQESMLINVDNFKFINRDFHSVDNIEFIHKLYTGYPQKIQNHNSIKYLKLTLTNKGYTHIHKTYYYV